MSVFIKKFLSERRLIHSFKNGLWLLWIDSSPLTEIFTIWNFIENVSRPLT